MLPSSRQPPRPAAKTDEFKPVRVIIALMVELAKVMDEEAALVNQRKFPEQKELVRKKQRMAMDYRASMKSFAAQPGILKALPTDLRTSLKEAAQRLAMSADKNARLLRTAILGTQRLLQSVITIVRNERLPTTGYHDTRKGKGSGGRGSYSPTCKPVTVSRTA